MLPLSLTLVIVVLDQVTKELIRIGFALEETVPVIDGFFNLTYVRNTGAAWGILLGKNTMLIVVSFVVLGVMLLFRRSFLSPTWEHRTATGLMMGGIIGNLIDRIRLGYVVDFLDFYVADYHWPSFNVADAGICVGVSIYIFSSLCLKNHPLHQQHG